MFYIRLQIADKQYGQSLSYSHFLKKIANRKIIGKSQTNATTFL